MRAIAADWKQTGIGEHRWMMRRVYQGSCCICKPPRFLPFFIFLSPPLLSFSSCPIIPKVRTGFEGNNFGQSFRVSKSRSICWIRREKNVALLEYETINDRKYCVDWSTRVKSNGSFGRRRTESRLRELWSVIRCPIMSLKLNKILASAPSSVSGLARPNIKTKDHFHASVTRLKGRWISLRVFSAETIIRLSRSSAESSVERATVSFLTVPSSSSVVARIFFALGITRRADASIFPVNKSLKTMRD